MEVILIHIIAIVRTIVIMIRLYWITDKVNFLVKDTFNHINTGKEKS